MLHLPGHSPGSIALYEAETQLLLSGDAIYDGVIVDTAPGSDGAAYRQTMTRLTKLPVRKLLGGHNDPVDGGRMTGIAERYRAVTTPTPA